MFRIPPPGGGGGNNQKVWRKGRTKGKGRREKRKKKRKLGENITVGSNKSLNMINKTQFNTTI